ncbi:hypothetical protein [Martelella mediterranea]|uniref:hypothetical protein n=1 Tax=Martelella mediterranea TaxID=293089 RepID=UPI0010503304|nr:hypothetical protein [Martelella mediterranea]
MSFLFSLKGGSHSELDTFKMAAAAGYLILGAKISSQSSKSRLLDPENRIETLFEIAVPINPISSVQRSVKPQHHPSYRPTRKKAGVLARPGFSVFAFANGL